MSHDPTIMATLELLAEKWPACFHLFEKHRLPLKIGIDQDIAAATPDTFTPDELTAALRFYCGNLHYLRACREGVARVGLDGEPAGTVTAADAAYAARIIARRRRKSNDVRIKSAESADKVRTAPTAPAPPKRISLADLRQAAARRKAAAS